MIKKIFMSVVMLFFIQKIDTTVSNKKHIDGSKLLNTTEFFIDNPELQSLQKSIKNKKKLKISHEQPVQSIHGFLSDVPRCIDAYSESFKHFSSEARYEFLSKQSITCLQEFYLAELTRLGWNVELLGTVKEIMIMATKPSKRIIIIIDEVQGGWFSKSVRKIIINIKEQ